MFYDVLMHDDGLESRACGRCSTTPDFSLDAVREMLSHPTTAWGLGDGGAHCGTTCDASTPTFMLTHWARDRAHDRLPLEWIVNKMTAETASLYGLGDRGVLQPGKIGDVNVIDFDHAAARDAGDGARPARRRPSLRATGSGLRHDRQVAAQVILCDGDDQGARPGRAAPRRALTRQ